MSKTIAYIAHPIGGAVKENLEDLVRILRKINLEYPDVSPIAPYYADILALDDSVTSERKRGIENDIALINTGVFDELWLTGSAVSNGMHEEMLLFRAQGKPIINMIGKL